MEQMDERPRPLLGATPTKEIEAVPLLAPAAPGKTSNPALPKFGIHMRYKGEGRTTELPLDTDMVGRLAIEAEFRSMRIGELVARLILTIAERDLFQLVLEPSPPIARQSG
jgi:hypothetical protein